MATIDFTKAKNLVHTESVIWSAVTASDVGEAREYAKFNDKTVQVFGTFGGTVSIEGSNDGTNWETLTDNLGVVLEFIAKGIKLIAENPRFVRPSAGSGVSSVTVIIQATRS